MATCSTCGMCEDKHQMNCPAVPLEHYPEHFRRYVSTMDGMIKRLESAVQRQHHMLTFWQGKFALVKHENNRLRRKLEGRE